jgi:tRNA(Ile)-lysidine synthase
VIRPLLAVRRRDSARYCAELQLPIRLDETNLDPAHLRNRVRHHLMPLLLSYNPSIDESLTGLASVVAEDEAELARLTDLAWFEIARSREAEVAFAWTDWVPLSAALQRRLLRRAGQHLIGQHGWSFGAVEAGRRLLEQRTPARRLSLGGGVGLATSRRGFSLRLRAGQPGPRPAEAGLEAGRCSTTSKRS